MIFRYTGPARISRRVTETAGVFTVNDALEGAFGAQLIKPNADEQTTDARSPRDQGPWRFRWRGGIFRPFGDSIRPGDRIREGTRDYEVTSLPRRVDEGHPGTDSFEVTAQPVAELYPVQVTLAEFDSSLIVEGVSVSLFRAVETHVGQGTYEDYDGEAPIEYQAVLQKNRQLEYGTGIYKITAVEVDRMGAYIRLGLRRSGG